MENVAGVKKKSKRKESRYGKRYGVEFKLRCVKLRLEEGIPVALLSKSVEKGVALSPRLAVLLERKNKGEVMKRLERRLTRLQSKTRLCERNPVKSGGLQEIGA